MLRLNRYATSDILTPLWAKYSPWMLISSPWILSWGLSQTVSNRWHWKWSSFHSQCSWGTPWTGLKQIKMLNTCTILWLRLWKDLSGWGVCFPSKDDLNDFKFNQAYMNWLMPIEAVCDPAVEQGWHAHHKCMISDMKFLDWVQAWCTHNHMLRTCFMLKPFILDVSSLAYKKQFEFWKSQLAFLGPCNYSCDHLHAGLCAIPSCLLPSDGQWAQAHSPLPSPC